MFGNHVFGTHILDGTGNDSIILQQDGLNSSSNKLAGLTSAFRPLKRKLPLANKGHDILYFYCISYKRLEVDSGMYIPNVHVYAKAMIYAYQQLIKTTNANFLEVGQVRFFIDRRCLEVVRPYCAAAGLESLIIPYDSDKNVDYCAYMQFFDHEFARGFKYIMYTDIDEFWANPKKGPAFDWKDMVIHCNRVEADIFGNDVKKKPEYIYTDLYERYEQGKDRLKEKKAFMQREFGAELPPEEFQVGITGSKQIIRKGPASQAVTAYYRANADLFRCDEGLWLLFLAKHNFLRFPLPLTIGHTPQGHAGLHNIGWYHFYHLQPENVQYHREIYDDTLRGEGL